MLFGILLLIGICITIFFQKRYKEGEILYRDREMTWTEKANRDGCRIVSGVLTVLILLVLLLSNGEGYFNHIDNIESIERDKKVVTIYKDKAVSLTKQFAKYLMNYSDFEKDIYSQISPKDVEIYLVKYPELKSSKTVLALVDNIYKLQDDVYATEIAIEDHKKDMRARLRNPFIFTSILPSE